MIDLTHGAGSWLCLVGWVTDQRMSKFSAQVTGNKINEQISTQNKL